MQLSTTIGYVLIGMLATAAWAPILIDLLYKFNIVVRHKLMPGGMNAEFIKIQGHKAGTPTLGGLMISMTVLVLTLLLIPYNPLRTVFLAGWTLFTLYGLIEGLMVYARKMRPSFRLFMESLVWRLGKFVVLYLLCVLMLWLFKSELKLSSLSFFDVISIDVNALSIGVGGIFMALAIYGMEIVDGADGLVTGVFLANTLGLLIIVHTIFAQAAAPYLALMLGSMLVYLYFNINPARVFMGGTGTFPIAFALLMFAVLTNTLDVFIIMGVIYWVDLASSAIQIVSIKFFKRKVFKIAPLHHHFEAIGWGETKMVQRFWLAAMVATIVALWVFGLRM